MSEHTCQVYCDNPWHQYTCQDGFTYCWKALEHERLCGACIDQHLETGLSWGFKETCRCMEISVDVPQQPGAGPGAGEG